MRQALEALGLKVNRLIRVSYGPFQLDDLGPGALEEVPPSELLSELSQYIPEKRRPAPFVERKAAPKGKPVHAKQAPKPAPRVEGDEGQRRQGLNAFVDKRPGKQRASDKRGPTGRPSTGKPKRPGAPRGGKPGGAGTRSRGR